MSTPLPEGCFRKIFCQQQNVPLERYEETVLRLTLYPHARWLTWGGGQDRLAPDRTFVAAVGLLTRWRDFADEACEYQHAPENRAFLRRRLRLRVSVRRMRTIFSEAMGSVGGPS